MTAGSVLLLLHPLVHWSSAGAAGAVCIYTQEIAVSTECKVLSTTEIHGKLMVDIRCQL